MEFTKEEKDWIEENILCTLDSCRTDGKMGEFNFNDYEGDAEVKLQIPIMKSIKEKLEQ